MTPSNTDAGRHECHGRIVHRNLVHDRRILHQLALSSELHRLALNAGLLAARLPHGGLLSSGMARAMTAPCNGLAMRRSGLRL
jgi:hypothetical protein